ncbi:ATP synthase subunit g, mitochondrial [Bulinus truncatus]|nr:ATP synthase subunit g, mitochondrial [Bulinus truncatus]
MTYVELFSPLQQKIPKMAKVVTYFSSKGNALLALTKPRLTTAWRYAKVELRPPTLGEMSEVPLGVQRLILSAKTYKWRQLTVKEAFVNTLVGAEIAFWFFAGECIGKGSIVGYDIPGAVNWDIHF